MTDITKHYTKKEGEGNDCEDTWIDLFVRWDTVGVNNFLENPGDFIQFKVTRGLDFVIFYHFESRYLHIWIFILNSFNLSQDCLIFWFGNPAEA